MDTNTTNESSTPKYVMALDAGTTSNRGILLDSTDKIVSIAQKALN